MAIQWETVAIPVAKGIDVNTRARLLEPGTLLQAENTRFHGGGAEKRRGHVSRIVRSTTAIPPGHAGDDLVAPGAWEPFSTGDRGIPTDWVFGWGRNIGDRTGHGSQCQTSPHPDAGLLFGAAQRDNESLLWNGHLLFSRTPNQPAGAPLVPAGPAVMPHLRSATVAKCSQAQNYPDLADNGTIRVVAWVDPLTDKGTYSVIDSVSGATYVRATTLSLANPTYAVRCIPVGEWVHVLCSDTAGSLQCFSVHQATPTAVSNRSLGPCDRFFDVWKVSESHWVTAANTGSNSIQVVNLRPDASNAALATPAWVASRSTLSSGMSEPLINLNCIAVAVHPTLDALALVFRCQDSATTRVYWSCFTTQGVVTAATTVVDNLANATRVTVAPKYIPDTATAAFDIYWNRGFTAGSLSIFFSRVSVTTPTPSLSTRRWQVTLGSQAFRVGDRTYVWAAQVSTYQTTWYLLDEELLPVGHLDYGTANASINPIGVTPSVNWSGEAPVKDTLVHHCALGYRVRVAVTRRSLGTNVPAVYAEPSIRHVQLDFLPPLRASQAGRSLYFAGAHLWAYDGNSLTESGFHHAPEVSTAFIAGGALPDTYKYRYRVDLCHVNAQGEEVRSNSFYTDEMTVAAPNQTVQLTIQTALTRRDAYFLIFRNENKGTQWFLINSRDPDSANYLANDSTVATVTFNDAYAVTDASLIQLEAHPGNGGFSYVEPVSAPACEIVAAGADRLWVAGGELPPGQVAPSRLFDPRDTPAFNPLVNAQIDRSAEPVTAIGFIGDVVVVFRETATYIQEGPGPDNSSNGYWPPARLALAGLGAISQESLQTIPGALVFATPVGIRAMGASGQLTPIGVPVDRLARTLTFSGSFVSTNDGEVRWYTRSGTTLVYSYQYDAWSTWTVPAAGVVRNPVTGLAVIAHPEGRLWEETADHWRDDNHPYRQRIRFAWLRAGSLVDFQRVRRVAGVGEADTAHTVRLAVFYDEQPHESEVITWDYPEDAADPSWNTDTFGGNTFGAGVLGDTEI